MKVNFVTLIIALSMVEGQPGPNDNDNCGRGPVMSMMSMMMRVF